MSGCQQAQRLENSVRAVKGDISSLARKMTHMRNDPSTKMLKQLEVFKTELKERRRLQVDHEIYCAKCTLGEETS